MIFIFLIILLGATTRTCEQQSVGRRSINGAEKTPYAFVVRRRSLMGF